jgi:hypothetical protein
MQKNNSEKIYLSYINYTNWLSILNYNQFMQIGPILHVDLYLEFLWLFGVQLSSTYANIFAEFYMDMLNGAQLSEACDIMKINAIRKYNIQMFKLFNFKQTIHNVRIKCQNSDQLLIYIITFDMLSSNKKNKTIEYTLRYTPSIRLDKLIKSNGLTRDLYELILYYIILDYEHILFVGPNPKLYKIIEDNYKCIECFASIFNHTCRDFYSALQLEKKFGSKGNFYDKFLLDTTYQVYLINPPYTNHILLNVYELVVRKVENSNATIIMYIPNWKHLTAKLIKNLKYYKCKPLEKHSTYNHAHEKLTCKHINVVLLVCSKIEKNVNKIWNIIDGVLDCDNEDFAEITYAKNTVRILSQ